MYPTDRMTARGSGRRLVVLLALAVLSTLLTNLPNPPQAGAQSDVVLLKHAGASDAHMVYRGEGVRRWVNADCVNQIRSAGLPIGSFTNWDTEVAVYPAAGTRSCDQYKAVLGGSTSTPIPTPSPDPDFDPDELTAALGSRQARCVRNHVFRDGDFLQRNLSTRNSAGDLEGFSVRLILKNGFFRHEVKENGRWHELLRSHIDVGVNGTVYVKKNGRVQYRNANRKVLHATGNAHRAGARWCIGSDWSFVQEAVADGRRLGSNGISCTSPHKRALSLVGQAYEETYRKLPSESNFRRIREKTRAITETRVWFRMCEWTLYGDPYTYIAYPLQAITGDTDSIQVLDVRKRHANPQLGGWTIRYHPYACESTSSAKYSFLELPVGPAAFVWLSAGIAAAVAEQSEATTCKRYFPEDEPMVSSITIANAKPDILPLAEPREHSVYRGPRGQGQAEWTWLVEYSIR